MLFHEIVDIDVVLPALKAQEAPVSYITHFRQDHSAPSFVGQTATAAKAPKLVLYHLVPANPKLGGPRWKSLISPHYAGEIVVGKDLLEIA